MWQKYRADVVLAAIFCFAYILKVNDNKDRILTDKFEFSTLDFVKWAQKNN